MDLPPEAGGLLRELTCTRDDPSHRAGAGLLDYGYGFS